MNKRLKFSYLSLVIVLLLTLLAACGDPTATTTPATTTAAATTAATTAAATTTAAASQTTAAATTTAAVATTVTSTASGKLIVGVTGLSQNLDPVVGGEFGFAPQNYMQTAYIDTLTRMEGSKVSPGLAVSWKNLDTNTWEFKLRKGVKFHNGEDFDSASLKFTFDTYFAQKDLFVRMQTVEKGSWTASDAETFTFKTKVPDALIPTKMSQIVILPAKYYAEKGTDGFKAAPVGTGPFQFVSYERDKQVTFKANPTYWRGSPKIAELVFKQIQDRATQVQALKTGEVDLIVLASKDQYDSLKSQNFKVYDTLIGSTTVIDLQTTKGGPLADKRVRQALNLAINKPEMIEAIFGKLTQVAVQIPSPIAFGYDAGVKGDSYDVEKAKALLKEAGINDGDLSLEINYNASGVGRKEMLEATSQYLAKIGVKVTPKVLDTATYFKLFNSNELGPAAVIARVYSPSLDGVLSVEWFTKFFATARYNNDDLNKLYEQALGEFDVTKREALVKQMSKLLVEDYSCIPLSYGFDMFATGPKVEGFKPSPNGFLELLGVSKAS